MTDETSGPQPGPMRVPYSAEVLKEVIDLMTRKANDYQNPNSTVRQADYYPQGIMTLLDSIHGKALRARSVAEAMRGDVTYNENFESIEDSFKDLIAYAAFGVSWCRGMIDGQNSDTGLFSNTLKSDQLDVQIKAKKTQITKKARHKKLMDEAIAHIKLMHKAHGPGDPSSYHQSPGAGLYFGDLVTIKEATQVVKDTVLSEGESESSAEKLSRMRAAPTAEYEPKAPYVPTEELVQSVEEAVKDESDWKPTEESAKPEPVVDAGPGNKELMADFVAISETGELQIDQEKLDKIIGETVPELRPEAKEEMSASEKLEKLRGAEAQKLPEPVIPESVPYVDSTSSLIDDKLKDS